MEVEKNIGQIQVSMAKMDSNIEHIIERLKCLCCEAHTTKIQELEVEIGKIDGGIFKKLFATAVSVIGVVSVVLMILFNVGLIK